MSDSTDDEGLRISWLEIYVSQVEELRGKPAEPLQVTDLVDHYGRIMRIQDELQKFCHDVLSKHVR